MRGKQQRIGIMTSPELLPKTGEKGKKNKHQKATSFESSGDGTGAYSVSVSSNGQTARDQDDEPGLGMRGTGLLPGWSAGWGVQTYDENGRRITGRVERRGDGRVESIMLHDVGSLLK